ncbi:MAG: GGDEF domain-containing protein [Bacillota bacterium]|nr:GGDEF domain-containing protein [Bacillota bacterium]
MLEKKLYKIILFISFSISIISILGNLISGFSLLINIKWIILALLSTYSYYRARYKDNIEASKFLFFVFLILVFLPFAHIDSGGSANNSIGYIFLMLICITYLFKSKKRAILVILHIFMFILLHITEYIHPELISTYSSQNQFIDRLIQIPLIMLVSYFIIKKFAVAYEEQKMLQNKYSEELEEANKRLRFMANYDELTSLYNRRVFNHALDEIKENETMIDLEIYIALIDVDFFKKINDEFGHLIGDKILIEFSSKLKDIIIEPNIISRWGGDEFSLIFYGSEQELIDLLNNMKKIYSDVVDFYGANSGISVGGTKWKKDMEIAEIMKLVDYALYESKDLGRGITTIRTFSELNSISC